MQKICIIIPCYNEEKRLPVLSFKEYLLTHPHVNFCFVNDGSNDDTLKVLNVLEINYPENVFILNLKHNVGKSNAVREGMLHCAKLNTYNYIGFFDADLSTPLTELEYFIELANNGHQIIIGSRVKRLGANIQRSAKRHILGRVFATFASITLKLGAYDTQCGAKLFNSKIVEEIFSDPFISKWIFDIEILFRAKNLLKNSREKKIYELPLTNWIEKSGSKISYSYFLKVPIELIKIKKKYT